MHIFKFVFCFLVCCLHHIPSELTLQIHGILIIFALHRLAIALDGCIRINDDNLARFHSNDLELHRVNTAPNKETVALSCRPESSMEARFQVGLDEVLGDVKAN